MEQSLGFIAQRESGLVCRLKEAIYELKQSPYTWFDKVSNVLILVGFVGCHFDHSIFVHRTRFKLLLILIVYVDGIIFYSSDLNGLDEVKNKLKETFQIRDLGQLLFRYLINTYQKLNGSIPKKIYAIYTNKNGYVRI